MSKEIDLFVNFYRLNSNKQVEVIAHFCKNHEVPNKAKRTHYNFIVWIIDADLVNEFLSIIKSNKTID